MVRMSWKDVDGKILKFPREWTSSGVTEFNKTYYYQGDTFSSLSIYKLEGDEIVDYSCYAERRYFRNFNEKCIDKPTREVIYIKRK